MRGTLFFVSLLEKYNPLCIRGLECTPGRSRTCDLRYRKPTLYPAELRALLYVSSIKTKDTSYIISIPVAKLPVTPKSERRRRKLRARLIISMDISILQLCSVQAYSMSGKYSGLFYQAAQYLSKLLEAVLSRFNRIGEQHGDSHGTHTTWNWRNCRTFL